MKIIYKPFNFFIKKTKAYQDIYKELENIKKHFSLKNQIVTIRSGADFFVPDHLTDYIQKEIVVSNDFYERSLLERLDVFISEHSVIIDAGANIGNHSIYWGTQRKAKKIFAFEPIKETHRKLLKNIELNSLKTTVEAFNLALGECQSHAEILKYNVNNIGGTELKKSVVGDIQVVALDVILAGKLTRLDLIKIDVEGFEVNVLNGAKLLINKFKPTIFIESFGKNNRKVMLLMKELDYYQADKLADGNFIYLHSLKKHK